MNLTFFCTGRADWSAVIAMFRLTSGNATSSRVAVCGDWEFVSGEARREGCTDLVAPLVTVAGNADGGPVAALARLVTALHAEVEAHPPDCLVLTGDRYELLAALAVAVTLRIPIAHISGGECTFGALDEQVRHAVTKAAHLHFVANEIFAHRLRHMGEEAWRIHVTGDPGLDCIPRAEMASPADLEALLGFKPDRETVLVAFHPVTNEPSETWSAWGALAEALEHCEGQVVVTGCNADPQGDDLRAMQEAWCRGQARRCFRAHLGQRNFLGLLNAGACLLGNSSAGIWEAPSLGSPAINLGRRQEGRLRGTNVIDVDEPSAEAVRSALAKAQQPAWRARLLPPENPYGDGHAAPRIVEVLRHLPPRGELLTKRFTDLKP